MFAMATYVQEKANELRDKPYLYYQWFYNEWLPSIDSSVAPMKDRRSWPMDHYKADIALLAWLHAELVWKVAESV